MSASLHDQLAEAEAGVEHLRQRIAAETSCSVRGHRWKFIGGMNACCGEDCGCSIPVHECEDCGDCDYGDTPEAAEVRRACAEATHDC